MSQRLTVLLLVLVARLASASPRAIVADGDIQLRAAIADSLRPWLIEVIAAPSAPADQAAATQQASAAGARYVIWREGAELVVLDREGDRIERRAAPAGTLDALAAAAAALSVKTMLRLPALPAVGRTRRRVMLVPCGHRHSSSCSRSARP